MLVAHLVEDTRVRRTLPLYCRWVFSDSAHDWICIASVPLTSQLMLQGFLSTGLLYLETFFYMPHTTGEHPLGLILPWYNTLLPIFQCALKDNIQKQQGEKSLVIAAILKNIRQERMEGLKYSEIGHFLHNPLKELKTKDTFCAALLIPFLVFHWTWFARFSLSTLWIVWTHRWLRTPLFK